jgi:hypothetical protein
MPLDRRGNVRTEKNIFKETHITTIKSGILLQKTQYLKTDLFQFTGYNGDHTIEDIWIPPIVIHASKIKIGYMMMLDVLKEFG